MLRGCEYRATENGKVEGLFTKIKGMHEMFIKNTTLVCWL
jgi:hypothetical protein